MPEYVLNRNYTLRSLLGHSVQFIKNEPVNVPALIEKEARAIGAERVDGKNPDVLDPEREEVAPLSAQERLEQITTAFELLVERNDPKDFTGAGVPSVKAVEKILGFDVDRNEVTRAWAAMRASQGE
jgi:hypothetical protein